MADINLKNKPLVEAIFEARWMLASPVPNVEVDPTFKLLLGRYYDRITKDYPAYEQLPAALIPDEIIAGRLAQYRFRAKAGGWPLIQLGPGLITVNSTADYLWSDFKGRCLKAVETLYASHPKPDELKIVGMSLRYIDAVDFNVLGDNVLDFLSKEMRVGVHLPETLFGDEVQRNPQNIHIGMTFLTKKPKGAVTLRFYNGMKSDTSALIWETVCEAQGPDLPSIPKDFEGWLTQAHDVTHNWFFTLIEGHLREMFE